MINFAKSGEGNPVILVHGLAASNFDWVNLIPELNLSGFCSYAPDLPGHGKSDGLENNAAYSIDHIYSLFQNWIDELQIEESLIIIGHSLGGYLAIQYTLYHPEKVASLILCDPLVSLDQLPFWLRIIYRYKIIDLNLIQRLPQSLIRAAIDLTSLSIRNGFVLSDDVREQTAADYKRTRPGIFNILYSLGNLTSSLSKLNLPTLLIWGSKDTTLNPATFPMLAKRIPNCTAAEIVSAGHVPHQSHSEEFNKLVKKFLLAERKPASSR